MYDLYELVIEKNDYKRIAKLEKLTNIETYWNDVRKFTRNVTSDHALRRWEILSDFYYYNILDK